MRRSANECSTSRALGLESAFWTSPPAEESQRSAPRIEWHRTATSSAWRAMVPDGRLVIAVWAAPERAPFFALPRRVLAPYRPLPPIDPEAPGMFRYADPERLRRDLEDAGFRVVHQEEADVPVMELETVPEVITYTRAFGLTRLLNDLPEEAQRAWEESFAKELEAFRDGSVIRLGGVTRVVVAS